MYDYDFEEMEMPCPCNNCGDWFDLYDGSASEKWYPNTVICKSCGDKEDQEVDIDNEEADLLIEIENGNSIRANKKRLKEIGRPFKKED